MTQTNKPLPDIVFYQRTSAEGKKLVEHWCKHKNLDLPQIEKDLFQCFFECGAEWLNNDIRNTINGYVEDMHKYERQGEFENGFIYGVEKFAEYLTEKLT